MIGRVPRADRARSPDMWRIVTTVGLLIGSNTFMTFAWYYHVQKKEAWPLWIAIAASWLIALPEYILQVPANRFGHISGGGPFTLGQLKIIQEAITLVIFLLFTMFVAKERIRPNEFIAMGLIMAGVVIGMMGRK
jgi:uncharacterized protein (DUF486 family)